MSKRKESESVVESDERKKDVKDVNSAGYDDLLKYSKSQWRAYKATSRYDINPELIDWFYPPADYMTKWKTDNVARFEGDDENFYYNYDGEEDLKGEKILYEDGIPRHVVDDRAIRLSNIEVLKELVPKVVPSDSYFEPGELAVIESLDNPFRAPCRHIFGIFT